MDLEQGKKDHEERMKKEEEIREKLKKSRLECLVELLEGVEEKRAKCNEDDEMYKKHGM